jgi:hypothetical protein
MFVFQLRVVHQNREDEKNPTGFFEFLSIRSEPVFSNGIRPADPELAEVVRPCFGSSGPLTNSMERIRGWALIIKWKIRKTGDACEDLERLRFYDWLFGRNKIVPQAEKQVIKICGKGVLFPLVKKLIQVQ